MRRPRLTPFVLLTLSAAAVTASGGTGLAVATFHDAKYGFTVAVPPGWKVVPADVVQQTAAAVQTPEAARTLVYRTAMEPAEHKQWFTYPYVAVQIIPFAAFGVDRQLTEDEMVGVAKTIAGTDLTQLKRDRIRDAARSMLSNLDAGKAQLDVTTGQMSYPMSADVAGVGKVRGVNLGFFGRHGMVQIVVTAKADDWDRQAAPALKALAASFQFDPGNGMTPPPAATQPAR